GELARLQTKNVVVLLERARLAAKYNDAEALRDSVARLGELAPSWPEKGRDIFRELDDVSKGNLRLAAMRVVFLRNVLVQAPSFRQDLSAVETPAGTVGEPIEQFLRLTPPRPTPSPPDDALAFAIESLGASASAQGVFLLPDGEGTPALFVANGREVRRTDGTGPVLPFPGGPTATISPHGVLAVDLNSDFRIDLVLAGAGGLRFFQQKPDGTFADVTAATGLSPEVLGLNAFGAWVADIEMDGDLDIVLGVRDKGSTVLRNNNDGTFGIVQPFAGTIDVRDFAWADLDQDGDPDAAMVDARGLLHVYRNERAGRFQARPGPEHLDNVGALEAADVNGDGIVDLVAVCTDGSVRRISDKDEGNAWEVAQLPLAPGASEGADRLFVADLDNNGALDLICSGPAGAWIALGGEAGIWRTVSSPPNLRISAVADLNADGLLDLAGMSADGRPARGLGRGTKGYHWQVIRPRGARTFGDGRINSFGIGGEAQLRAGMLVQKQVISGPILHFGLGDQPTADYVRIFWPNGTVQGEFDTKADQTLVAEQRLKGSCPFLFAFDGTGMRFVTDFIWRSPLGLRINAQDTAGVSQTEDWVKIAGDQLVASEGYYDLRITAELWETHFWDHMSLMVVDHPRDTEIFVDERFARQPPPLAVHTTGPMHPIAYAWDDTGRDVTEIVRARDGRYLDTFGRGAYQGVTRDHWVEAELGDDVPWDRPLRLIAHGWIHPTDSSINVAISQGHHAQPQGLVLEVPAADGSWTVARSDLGFPAGKNKTILVDLDGIFRPGCRRHFRLRTNLEIFWDSLTVATVLAESPLKLVRIAPASAELRPRGYSLMTQANESSPELPRYDSLTGTGQRWLDLIGYYTRYGDVRDLVQTVDDRYVIANAGDELALRFTAPPPPPAGWMRDFVMVGDGWNKDGDYNTAFSKTVLPLPSHKSSRYDTPPVTLEDDPVFRLHQEDWREYHTRYITPKEFQVGVRPPLYGRPRRQAESNP
ncbi:MAG TPA: CRTAC1 family protein, partial [Isosphaeraceae bacterium]|nr:CRTAC1 family protein [Isosphaeraceae bacterium]